MYVAWAPGTAGPAPTSYVVHVTGSAVGTVATTGRTLFGAVAPGSYTVERGGGQFVRRGPRHHAADDRRALATTVYEGFLDQILGRSGTTPCDVRDRDGPTERLTAPEASRRM